MRFRIRQERDRWYVDDTLVTRSIAGIGPDARPSNAASLTLTEAKVIERVLNSLYHEEHQA